MPGKAFYGRTQKSLFRLLPSTLCADLAAVIIENLKEKNAATAFRAPAEGGILPLQDFA